MKRKKSLIALSTVLAAALLITPSCANKNKSKTTGFGYNSKKWGGFENHKYKGQETGPGLVLVPGGAFVMGSTEQDVLFEYNNVERKATVNSFYMDQTEVSNLQYGEYVWWLQRVFVTYPEVYKQALPDTLTWRSRLSLQRTVC